MEEYFLTDTKPRTTRLVASKIKDKELKKEAVNEVAETFGDSKKYFNIDEKLIVGRAPSGPKYKLRELIPYSIVGLDYYHLVKNDKKLTINTSASNANALMQLIPKSIKKESVIQSPKPRYTSIPNNMLKLKSVTLGGTVMTSDNININISPTSTMINTSNSNRTSLNTYRKEKTRNTTLLETISLGKENSNIMMSTKGLNLNDQSSTKEKTINIDFISDNALITLYDKKSRQIAKNDVNSFMKNLPRDIKKKLKMQENSINFKISQDKATDLILARIAKKSQKDKSDTLMSKSASFRAKQELRQLFCKMKETRELNRYYSWALELRKSENFKGEYTGQINVGSNDFPKWQIVKEYLPSKPVEIIRKPELEANEDLKKMTTSSSFMKTLSSLNLSFKEIETTKLIKIDGKNLLEAEKEHSLAMPGKKYIHVKEKDDLPNDQVIETFKESYSCLPLPKRETNTASLLSKFTSSTLKAKIKAIKAKPLVLKPN